MSELRELRQLQEEDGRLKRLVADLSVDRQILLGDCLKRAVKPRLRRRLARWPRRPYRISERHAARLVGLAIGTLRYRSRKVFDQVSPHRLRELAGTHVRYGY